MRVDGKVIADQILTGLQSKASSLKNQGVTPTLAVILVGDDPGSLSYIKQKKIAAEKIGATLILEQLPTTTSLEALDSAIAHYNSDPQVHGLIVQRPVPLSDAENILAHVSPAKDVDGFIPNSPFEVPVARAVKTILKSIHTQLYTTKLVQTDFLPWLKSQTIAVVGRGETAGKPMAQMLADNDCTLFVVHSETPEPENILKNASIVISCTGKPRVIKKSNSSNGVILISVGLFRTEDGNLHGDYEESEMKDIASFYTPTPGGVGPINVACLMQNLVDSCILQKGGTP